MMQGIGKNKENVGYFHLSVAAKDSSSAMKVTITRRKKRMTQTTSLQV